MFSAYLVSAIITLLLAQNIPRTICGTTQQGVIRPGVSHTPPRSAL